MKYHGKIKIENAPCEVHANEKDAVFIQRYFMGHTNLDMEIQSLPIPKNPIWLNVMVRMIRYYQKVVSPKLGNRCVFDPSCSRYSESAYRKKGFIKGSLVTVKRLIRCRPSNGGVDILT